MAQQTRIALAKKVLEAYGLAESSQEWKQILPKLAWSIKFQNVDKKTNLERSQLSLPYKYLQACDLLEGEKWTEHKDNVTRWSKRIKPTDLMNHVKVGNSNLDFNVNTNYIKQHVLKEIIQQQSRYGLDSNIHHMRTDTDGHIIPQPQQENVVVEFSSPNIAKPFHAGHLRSTILGNFVANVNSALGHNVTKINYLGDWGTQFGLVGVGFQKYGSHQEMEANAMKHLYDVYVRVNQEVAEQTLKGHFSDEVASAGREFFLKMEQGDQEVLKLWQSCRDQSIHAYTQVYERLGIIFNHYHGESMYRNSQQKTKDVLEELRQKGLLQFHKNTGVGYVDLSSENKNLHANVLKSDGTSLYVTRDIAAAIDRAEKFKFDRMHYLVENGQHLHFLQFVGVLKKMGYSWAKRDVSEFHVKFGRIDGMSTRSGQVVFLSDVLDEAKSRMLYSMLTSASSKKLDDIEGTADILGRSAVFIQDLKQRRMKNYPFKWDYIMRYNSQSGVFLQYTHARLCSLERNCGLDVNTECSLDSLDDPQFIRIIVHLAQYDEAIQGSFVELEPCIITHYLLGLCSLVNVAFQDKPVKGQSSEVAEPRLLLFHAARIVLANGLKLLGLPPLDTM